MDIHVNNWEYGMHLFPGEYQYLIVLDGKETLDPFNPDSIDNGTGGYNSRLTVGEPNKETPFISGSKINEDEVIIETSQDLKGSLVLWENIRLPDGLVNYNEGTLTFKIPSIAKSLDRSHLRIWAFNENGLSNDMLIPLKNGRVITGTADLNRKDKQSMRMYFLMVDRFLNGNKSNDKPVDDPDIKPLANYLGGDIAGVKQKVEQGFFNDLNMNTVWLSPIGLNPEGAWGLWDKGGVTSKFSGYHGYWPASSTKVDYRFGTDEELKELIESVHASKSNILLDYVANHVHQDHPVYKQHPEWATELYLPDGTMNTEKWDEYRLTTWFDTFLPTLDLANPEVYEAMSDSALYWFQNFEIDGFRHDATKHIPEVFWRSLTKKLKNQVMVPKNRFIYQIGETYGNAELIGSYVSSGQMDAQFDFNVYDKAINTFSNENNKMSDLALTLKESLTFYGYHNLMGYISGNQDRPRFTSLADGSIDPAEDSKLAGWTRKISNNGEIGFQRMAQLHALNFTIPGIPVIYYGDEIGIPGGNDPDNRRMMIFENLNEDQENIRNQVIKIAKLRKENMALNYGDLKFILADEFTLAYERIYFENKVVVIFNNDSKSKSFTIPNADAMKSNFGNKVTYGNGNAVLTLKPHSFDILTQ
jgi:glycosidase